MKNLFDEVKIDRINEYRIPERDCNKSGKLTLPNDAQITYNRYISRVGYALDKYSYSLKEWNEKGLELICNKSQLDEKTVLKVIYALNLKSPFKGIKNKIYWSLVGTKETDKMRSMWFVDFKENYYRAIPREEWHGVIIGRCRKWTGKYIPSHNWGDGDYDPPMLDGVNQNLYLVRNIDNGMTYIVHPDDINKKS